MRKVDEYRRNAVVTADLANKRSQPQRETAPAPHKTEMEI
jgi:hypothetical protein